jgi:hypothetical protein
MEETKLLENYKKKIIKQSIKILLNEINIDYTEEELFRILMQVKSKKQCIGITNNLKQCPRNAFDDLDYCKTHIKNYGLRKRTDTNLHTKEIEIIHTKEIIKENANLKKKFIDDTFYYIDDSYIYDIKTMEKVGIKSNGEFILTCDPFILKINNSF